MARTLTSTKCWAVILDPQLFGVDFRFNESQVAVLSEEFVEYDVERDAIRLKVAAFHHVLDEHNRFVATIANAFAESAVEPGPATAVSHCRKTYS